MSTKKFILVSLLTVFIGVPVLMLFISVTFRAMQVVFDYMNQLALWIC